MPPCHYACTIRDLLQIKMGELANLNQVREDLDDLCFHEPNRHQEVMAKLNVVNEMVKKQVGRSPPNDTVHRIWMPPLPPRGGSSL